MFLHNFLRFLLWHHVHNAHELSAILANNCNMMLATKASSEYMFKSYCLALMEP